MEEIRFCPKHGFYRGSKCSCGYEGETVAEGWKVEKLSRFLMGLLRHFPERFNLAYDKNGWIDFDLLTRVVEKKYRWANRWLIKAIILSDTKERYELSSGKIRARYGHSIEVALEDMPEALEETLYYGTSEEEAQRILEIGIKSVDRCYVHLSTTIERAFEVASIRTENPIAIEIDAKAAKEEGIRIIKANENIALAKEIPQKYIKKLIKLDYSSSK